MAVLGGSGEVESTGEEFDLPARFCSRCGEHQWDRNLARYDLGVPERVDKSVVAVSAGWRVLPIEEFEKLVCEFGLEENDPAKIVPGMKIGHPVLHLTTAPRDFVFEGLVMLISEKTLDCLRSREVHIRVHPVEVIGRGNKRHRYFNVLIPVLSLADQEWMSIERAQCPRCLEWWKKPGVRLPKKVKTSNAHLVENTWPEGEGVVYSTDIGAVYYSSEFVRTCHDAQLSGIGFEPVFWA